MSNMPNQGQPYQPPQSGGGGSSALKIIMIVLGVLALGCVCCAGAGYFGWGSMMNAANKEIYGQLKDIPAVQEQFGQLDENSVEMSIMDTAKYAQENPEIGQAIVINVSGTKGSGQIICRQRGEQFDPIRIVKDGETIDLEEMDDLPTIDMGDGDTEEAGE